MIVIKRKCVLGDAGQQISKPTRAQLDFARRNPTVCKIVEAKKPRYKPVKSNHTKSNAVKGIEKKDGK